MLIDERIWRYLKANYPKFKRKLHSVVQDTLGIVLVLGCLIGEGIWQASKFNIAASLLRGMF